MKENRHNKRKFRKERRGVGAIIGGVLLVAILLTTVLLYFITILNNDERKALYDVQSSQIDQNKAAENLSVTSLQLETNPGGETGLFLKTLIANEGSLPLVVSHSAAYCITCASPNNPSPGLNNTAVPLNIRDSATRYVPVSVDNNYTAGFITERGNIFYSENCKIVTATEMACTDSGSESTGPFFEISVSQDTFFLEAGQSGEESIINVTSRNDFNENVNVSVDAETGITAVLNPVAPTVTPLPGESVEAATLTIGTLEGISEGNYLVTVNGVTDDGSISDSETITIVIFDPTSDGEDGKEDDSIIKPQIQGVFPSPHGSMGSSLKEGLWGVLVVNPANSTMTVTKVVITAFAPSGSNMVVFPSNGNNCQLPATPVLPLNGTWSCPATNTLVWTGSFTIAKYSAQEFFATIGKPSSSESYPSYSINFNVFTNFGQYAKAGYSGAMAKTGPSSTKEVIANVYLSTTKDSTAIATILGKHSVTSGGTLTIVATIANMGDGSALIEKDTKLIVVVHKAFKVGTIAPNPPHSDFNPCTKTDLGDGSTQITCTLNKDLAAGVARSVEFTVTAPLLTDTTPKLYPLLVLADGTDNNPAPLGSVGPIAENVIVVTP
jgi:hypothetical protein